MKSNMLEYTSYSVLIKYLAFIDEIPDKLQNNSFFTLPPSFVLIISTTPLSTSAKTALKASANKIGFPNKSCTFVVTQHKAEVLQPSSLFEIVEGLDPLAVIITDTPATQTLSVSFDTEILMLQPTRFGGRPTIAFNSFEDMLSTDNQKQKAWSLLKTLRTN